MPTAPAGGDAEVGGAGLPRAIDHAAHDRHLHRQLPLGEGGHGLARHLDHVDLGPSAARAGDEVDAGALTQAEGLEQLATGPRLFHRVGGEAVADGVTDALHQQGGDAGGGLDQPARRWPGLGDAQVQRVVDGVGQHAVGLDHKTHVGRLHRDLHVVEPHLGEVGQLPLGRGHQRLGGHTQTGLDVGVEGAGVDPDADGNTAISGGCRHRLDVLGLADVARIEPQAGHTRLEGGQGEAVLEVDVGHDGHR